VAVERLTWRPYGRREPVLREVTLSLAAGERVLLVGPSGSGKSTLLRALAGLLETVDAGELTGRVAVDGDAPGARPGAVGLVLQEPGAGVVAATVGRDVAFGPENVGLPRDRMPPVVAAALSAVGLGDLPHDTPTSALSGGQTQRLALAGALALDPSVLLLDEPTAMLDPGSAAEVRAAVATLVARDRRTLVVVEHVLGPWVDLVERLVVLSEDGRVAADGPVREVLARERCRLIDLGIWVPGEPAPAPVPVDPGLLLVRPDGGRAAPEGVGAEPGVEGDAGSPGTVAALRTDAFVVERTTRLLDGTTRTLRAADLAEGLAATPGTLTVLVGPSGSGKSTVLHALAGFVGAVPADAVRVPSPRRGPDLSVDTRTGAEVPPSSLSAPDLARSIAWVPQWSSSTIVADTVLDEVLLTSRALGDTEAATTERGRGLLAALGLDHLERADPRELSGGEQRRLAVAAALLHGPPVLLADEPTVGQDRRTWAALVGLLAAYRAAGGAVLSATHDQHVVARATTQRRLWAAPRPEPDAQRRVPLLARCGPLALLAAALLAVPAGILSPHWTTSLLVLATQALLATVALAAPGRGPRPTGRTRRVALRTLPGLLAALSVGWSTWWLAGHDADAALTVALRVLVIVLPSAVVIPWMDPDALGDHLAQRLHLPDRPVVATAAALQRIHTFGEIWSEIGRARRVRGLEASWRRPAALAAHLGAVTTGLLVRTLRAAAELAVAMDARGFATAQARTWWAPATWGWRDTAFTALATLPLVVAVTAR
jgi:energy-coupling factor transporter ATP-binding protein EcfA2/energy-coupling factor transporter transmembrane protein EcfT